MRASIGASMAKPKAKKPAKKPAAKKPVAKKSAAKKTDDKQYGARKDLDKPVTTYIGKLKGEQRAIADKLRATIDAIPGLTSGIKWGMAMWAHDKKMLTYFKANKADVRFGLVWKGAVKFDDPKGKLSDTGTDGAHVKFTTAAEIDPKEITRWILQLKASR